MKLNTKTKKLVRNANTPTDVREALIHMDMLVCSVGLRELEDMQTLLKWQRCLEAGMKPGFFDPRYLWSVPAQQRHLNTWIILAGLIVALEKKAPEHFEWIVSMLQTCQERMVLWTTGIELTTHWRAVAKGEEILREKDGSFYVVDDDELPF